MSNTVPAVPAGYTISYTQDTMLGNGWWADLRDELGRVRESGGGHTQEEARARLLERVARDPLADIDHEPRPGALALDGMITALVSTGYEVSFTVAPEGFVASVSGAPAAPCDYECDAIASTLADALAAALPDGFELCACGHAGGSHWEVAEPDGTRSGCAMLGCPCRMYGEYEPQLPAPTIETDVQTLSADMADVLGRLDALEGRAGKFDRTEAALVDALVALLIDSNPDGELARRVAARRAKEAAASGAEAAGA
jgi:hypothetical protein